MFFALGVFFTPPPPQKKKQRIGRRTKICGCLDQSFGMCSYRFPTSIWCPWTRFQYQFGDRITSSGPHGSSKIFSHTKNDQKWPYFGVFVFKLPKYGSPKQNLYDDPIKVLECVGIVFFSQFDVPEHVFNIGLMIGLLLMVLWTLPKSFHTRKILEKWPHLSPKGLVRKYTKNPCF